MKIKNNSLAIDAAPAAIPKKPKAPAMIAIIKKIAVQRNMIVRFKVNNTLLTRNSCHAAGPPNPLYFNVRIFLLP